MTLPLPMPNRGPSALRLAGALLLALSFPALAQEMSRPIGADEFQAYTEGRTLSYNFSGTPYGTEEYLPDRRVRWAFRDQECQDGVWYERNGNICFLYDNDPTDEQCWSFYATDDGLRGVFQGPDGPTTELYEVEQSSAPLSCMGPEVGV